MNRWLHFFFLFLAVSALGYAPEPKFTLVSAFKDGNGDLTNDGLHSFGYDAENQLTDITVAGAWKTEFVYDGLGRRRIARDYAWQGGAWVKTNETRFVFDRLLPVQERDGNNTVRVTYTRGRDLSGTLQCAGGIGGLLARSQHSTTNIQHAYYHADGAGNVTALMNAQGVLVARYLSDPFGNMIGQWGSLAEANRMQFSSMPRFRGLTGYPARFYEPGLQRWSSREPIGEAGSFNLYRFVRNNPLNRIDPDGREDVLMFDFQTDLNSPGFRQGTGEALRLLGPAAAEAGASMIPLVGEGMDLWVLGDPESRWWEKMLSGASLGFNALTGGLMPNAGGFLKGGKRVCKVGKADLDKLYPRTRPRQGLLDDVWERSKSPDGKVYDPSGVEIKPGEPWELSHRPGHKFSDAQKRAYEEGWDRKTWRDYQNDPDIYRPEKPRTNRGHRYEDDW